MRCLPNSEIVFGQGRSVRWVQQRDHSNCSYSKVQNYCKMEHGKWSSSCIFGFFFLLSDFFSASLCFLAFRRSLWYLLCVCAAYRTSFCCFLFGFFTHLYLSGNYLIGCMNSFRNLWNRYKTDLSTFNCITLQQHRTEILVAWCVPWRCCSVELSFVWISTRPSSICCRYDNVTCVWT